MPIDKARAKGLLGVTQKPQSAVTSWVDRICQSSKPVAESDLNQFIVELVEVINLQPTGSEEASRAVRKQLKHGDLPHQKNALNLLAALVLNGGSKFQTTFADERMIDCIKSLVYDPHTAPILRRQTLILLSYWAKTYQSDPKMSTVSGLFELCGGSQKLARLQPTPKESLPVLKPTVKNSTDSNNSNDLVSAMIAGLEKDTAKTIKAVEKSKKKEEEKRRKKPKDKLDQRFRTHLPLPLDHSSEIDLKEEAPRILNVVATAAQCANNLVNSIQLIDPAKDDITTDEKVQTNLEKAKMVQKSLIRYIRLVTDRDTNGEYIGTLLNTNAQVVAALQLYEKQIDPSELNSTTKALQNLNLRPTPAPDHGERGIFDDPEIPISPSLGIPSSTTYKEDLLGLDFGSEGHDESNRLPKPITPDSYHSSTQGKRNQDYDPGTLSDFSDFDSSDEDDPQSRLNSKKPIETSDLLSGTISDPVPEPSGSKSKNEVNKNPFEDPFI